MSIGFNRQPKSSPDCRQFVQIDIADFHEPLSKIRDAKSQPFVRAVRSARGGRCGPPKREYPFVERGGLDEVR